MAEKILYISGPYSAPNSTGRLVNTLAAIETGMLAYRKGWIPLIPHLSHWLDQVVEGWPELGPMSYEDYMRWDLAYVERCDAVLQFAPSPGADREVARARERGIPIYTCLEDLPYVEACDALDPDRAAGSDECAGGVAAGG
jgi:hypothetical protein